MKNRGKRVLAALLGVILFGNAAGQMKILPDYPQKIYGETQRAATVNATSLNVRSGPGTENSIVKRLDYGTSVTVLGETSGSNGVKWYRIRFTSGTQTQEGYASAAYIKFPVSYTTDMSFENELSRQGFPESYKDSLRVLHAEHPTWVFQIQDTGLDWNDVIQNEGAVGANLVATGSISSWKSTEYGAYDWRTGKWTGFDGASWVAASREIVAYYMDPRNFLNDIYIFQFLNHNYDGSQTKEGLQSLIQGTFLESGGTSGSETGTQTESNGPGSSSGTAGNNDTAGNSNAAENGNTSTSGNLRPGENVGPGFENHTEPTQSPQTDGGQAGQLSGQTQTEVRLEGPSVSDAGNTVQTSGRRLSVSARNLPTVMLPNVEYGPGMDASSITGDTTGAGTTSPTVTGGSYADIIMAAAAQSGVNPYVIGAMILQEQGKGTSGSISGKTSGYEGYYNFFNIGAYEDSAMSAVTRGLWYASQSGSYGRPWNSIEKSIIGGAVYYGDNYVKQGQDTFYLKKFNVQGDNLYKHQYMTNVEAAAGEGAKLARAYTDEMKNQALTFKIPVYKNMPESACAKPTMSGSPNNKLSALEVTGYSLTPTFSMDRENYDIIVNPSVNVVEVKASAMDSKASVNGVGSISLQSGNNTIRVQVTAENGSVRTYQLNVVRQSNAPVGSQSGQGSQTGSQTSNSGQNVGPGMTNGPGAQTGSGQNQGQAVQIGPGFETTASQTAEASNAASGTTTGQGDVQVGIAPDGSTMGNPSGPRDTAPAPETVQAPETAAPETTAAPKPAQAQETTAAPKPAQAPETTAAPKPAETRETAASKPAKTQETTAATAASNRKKGDCNGDGSVTILDLMVIRKHILGETKLSGAQAKAADVDGDGTITSKDADALKKLIFSN